MASKPHMHNHSAAADGPSKSGPAKNPLRPGVHEVHGPPKAGVKKGIDTALHSGPSPLDGR